MHWVIYNIPADVGALPEGVPRQAEASEPVAAQQGRNDFSSDNVGYRGPLPPQGSGPHRYVFQIYALDQRLDLAPSAASKDALLAAMQGHILGQGQLVGIFERE